MNIVDIIEKNSLVMSIGLVAVMLLLGQKTSRAIGQERMSSALSIIIALAIAGIVGVYTEGSNGIANIPLFSGMGILGSSMLRDYAIISTAYGAKWEDIKKAGLPGVIALLVGVVLSFAVGSLVAFAMGFRDPKDITTIGAGAVTFVVGPVTATAIGASSLASTLSVAAGVTKSVVTMIITPILAPHIGLDNPTSAMVYGGLIGTTSGVSGGLAATDPKLVPYGALTATFYTGLGTLLCPSVLYLAVLRILG